MTYFKNYIIVICFFVSSFCLVTELKAEDSSKDLKYEQDTHYEYVENCVNLLKSKYKYILGAKDAWLIIKDSIDDEKYSIEIENAQNIVKYAFENLEKLQEYKKVTPPSMLSKLPWNINDENVEDKREKMKIKELLELMLKYELVTIKEIEEKSFCEKTLDEIVDICSKIIDKMSDDSTMKVLKTWIKAITVGNYTQSIDEEYCRNLKSELIDFIISEDYTIRNRKIYKDDLESCEVLYVYQTFLKEYLRREIKHIWDNIVISDKKIFTDDTESVEFVNFYVKRDNIYEPIIKKITMDKGKYIIQLKLRKDEEVYYNVASIGYRDVPLKNKSTQHDIQANQNLKQDLDEERKYSFKKFNNESKFGKKVSEYLNYENFKLSAGSSVKDNKNYSLLLLTLEMPLLDFPISNEWCYNSGVKVEYFYSFDKEINPGYLNSELMLSDVIYNVGYSKWIPGIWAFLFKFDCNNNQCVDKGRYVFSLGTKLYWFNTFLGALGFELFPSKYNLINFFDIRAFLKAGQDYEKNKKPNGFIGIDISIILSQEINFSKKNDKNVEFIFEWRASYEKNQDEDKKIRSWIRFELALPISENSHFFIRYVIGELPEGVDYGDTITTGFSYNF